MSTVIAGEREAAQGLAADLPESENPRIWAPEAGPAGEPTDSSGPLARALVAFEADAIGQQPDRVLLADDSDAALAALLVATKLLIDVAATTDARARSTANGRVIAQLAEAYTRPA